MSAEFVSKFLKLSLRDSKIDADFGDGITLQTDLQIVKDAVTSAAGAIGIENCMKIGGAAAIATATFVAAKSLAAKWSWLSTTNVKAENVLEVAIPSKREEAFKKILESGQLERVVQDNFADLESNLEGVLGEEVDDKVRQQVIELIQDIKVSSVCESTAEISNNRVAMNIVDGEHNVTERNVDKFVAADGKGKSVVAMNIVGKSGKMKGTVTGGSYAVISGDSKFVKEAGAAHAKMNEKKVLVTVRFPVDLSPKFEQSFQPTDNILDIRSALKEDKEKLYFLVQEGKPGEILSDSLRVMDINKGLLGFESEETARAHKQ